MQDAEDDIIATILKLWTKIREDTLKRVPLFNNRITTPE